MSRLTCTNCHESPPFTGWDDCLACGVAVLLVEQPDYLAFARKTFAHKTAWLAQLEAEWARQAGATVACGAQRAA